MGDRCQTSGKVVEPELVFVVQELVCDEAVEADVLPVEVVVVVVEVRFVLDLEFVRSFVSEIVLANPSKIKY